MANTPVSQNALKSEIVSLFQGNQTTYSPLCARSIDSKSCTSKMLMTYQSKYENWNTSSDALLLLSRPFYKQGVGLNTFLTASEVSLLAGLPQKEVPGIALKESVEFGVNENHIADEEAIKLGNIVKKGRLLEELPFILSKNSLKKHIFIAGVTGSGKTTTCHRLLSEAKVPFLVIEPAKTEYRTLINRDEDLIVFTLGNESAAPFRINPFELLSGEIISAHVDMMKATFTSAFPMEASMPQILEEAIYQCYSDKGWDIDTNQNKIYEKHAFDRSVDSFPIMTELLEKMKKVVKSKHFSAQMEADYQGSLVSRLSNLTVGSKGQMLNCEHSVDFQYILKHNVVLEMEELKSPEDKALFMGFVLNRLSAVVKEEHTKDRNFQHITLIEEAHRLLSRADYGDSGAKKAAVETFTDLLAEVRKYGEGLIVVDQIPNKLAPEVLKNTNTKIIHKILAKDDKGAVGDTMLMDEKQKEYLSALPVGEAIVFSEHTARPVHVHITANSDTNETEVDPEKVKIRFQQTKDRFGEMCYEPMELRNAYYAYCKVSKLLSHGEVNEENRQRLRDAVLTLSKNLNMEQKEAWRKIIEKQDKLSGKSDQSSQDHDERIETLTEFFSTTFCKDNFSKKDLNLRICIYLM
jgi:hypothetical protein